jgi:DNA (cytosine-5)-methyltransferase 1
MTTLRFIEVCAGAGGLSTGLVRAGFTPILLNDLNKDCCRTLAANHPGVEVRCCPIDKLDLTPYRGGIDLLAGGVPCQPFSQAGRRRGLEDKRGNPFLVFIEMINSLQPRSFLIENVRGLLTLGKGKVFDDLVQRVDKSYRVWYKILNAADHGVPQKRERVFIVGVREGGDFVFPEPSLPRPCLRDALRDVPASEGAAYPEEKKRLFAMIPQGGCWVDLPVEMQRAYMKKSFESGGGKRGILHRLSMDRPSLTLLCSPSQKQTERCHPLENRPLTVREYARIQTFDDSYEFAGGTASKYRQIGNAVPVELARRVGLCLAETLSLG